MKKPVLFFVVVGIALVLSGFFWFSKMGRRTADNKAVDQQITSSERFSDPAQWQEFNQRWLAFKADERHGWEEYVSYAQGEGARYDCTKPIMNVGQETIYGCDINALFVLVDFDSYIQPKSLPSDSKEFTAVIDAVIIDSALLQEASKRNLVTLTDLFYNSSQKNTIERFGQLKSLREKHEFDMDKTFDFEAVVIYFHNQEPPRNISIADAKKAAENKMKVLHSMIQSGELTMEAAAAEIKANAITGDTTGVSLAQLDPLYSENAYIMQKGHKAASQFFKDVGMDATLKKLKKDQVSEVILCRDFAFTLSDSMENPDKEFPLVESCYAILKVTNISSGFIPESSNFESLDEYLLVSYKPTVEQK